MPAERVVDGKTVTYTGLVDFKSLYSSIKQYWDIKGFDTIIEKKHEEKVQDDGSKSINFEWHVEKKITDYVTYSYDFTITADKLKLVQVDNIEREYVENLNVKINGDLIYDFGKLFGEKPFDIFLRALFEKYIYGDELKDHKKNLTKIADDFLDMIKTITGQYKP